MQGLKVTVGPTFEPVTLAEAKAHCRVDISDDDALITSQISAARAYLEHTFGRAIAAQTILLHLAAFPLVSQSNPRGAIKLPRPPLASVTSVYYYDGTGELTQLDASAYQVDDVREPGEIVPAPGTDWPDSQEDRVGAVKVTYVAGVATAGAIDPRIKQAVLMLVAHWYENRETATVGQPSKELEHAVSAIMWQLWDGRLI